MTTAASLPKTYRARWVWSEGRWVEGGRVTVVGRQILSVTTERQPHEIDLGDRLMLPGLVNAHTHLEFSGLRAPLPYERTFASWIRQVVQWRRGQTDSSSREAIALGLAESAQAGVTQLGEISTHRWDAPESLGGAKLDLIPGINEPIQKPQMVVFREVLGLKPEAVSPQLADAHEHLRVGTSRPGDSVFTHRGQIQWCPEWIPGLSPHAPYSLSGELFDAVLHLAAQARCPVAMHIAETREELELLATESGPLADLFTEWGLWSAGQRAAFRTPLKVLQQLSVLPRVLVIHGNYLSTEELDYLTGKDQFSVVYCPRTHSYFQHDRYPLAQLLQRGIRVALGTDSRASNPDLNLLSEVRHVAQQYPEIAPSTLLEMATRSGAEALGRGDTVGRIAPGMQADFCVLQPRPGIRDPFEAVLDAV